MSVQFHSFYPGFALRKQKAVGKLILSLIRKENGSPSLREKKAGEINYVFCSDKFLLGLNKKFLKHNTLTDIITFQYTSKKLSGEIFISIPRVKENAKKYKTPFENELYRVMIHGSLHLCGFKDKTTAQKKKIREKEDYYLLKAKIR